MITIIKNGHLPKDEPVQVECDRCNAIFTYTKEDINSDPREGNYVICPCCKTFINT